MLEKKLITALYYPKKGRQTNRRYKVVYNSNKKFPIKLKKDSRDCYILEYITGDISIFKTDIDNLERELDPFRKLERDEFCYVAKMITLRRLHLDPCCLDARVLEE